MRELVLDVETDFTKLGGRKSSNSPFDSRNKLVCTALYAPYKDTEDCVATSDSERARIQALVDECDILINFNIKYDLHWLRHWGINFEGKKIWDCQLAEFLIRNQIGSYPSLNECLEKYGIPLKHDVVKTEYWDKGKLTSEVPWNILSEYAIGDTTKTYQVYLKQIALLSKIKQRLLSLQCQDLLVLQEMEWNGLQYDSALCEERASEISKKIENITTELNRIYPDVPINFNSSHQLSAFLYGGTVKQTVKEHVGYFKTGKQAGQPKYQNQEVLHQLPRLYTPLAGSEMAAEGVFSTDESTLKKLKGKRAVVDMLLSLAKLSKLNETYYEGLPLLNKTMNWEKDKLYGQFNQVVTITGRLSSSAPNLQNFASELQDIFVTRY